ncbi:MAG: hypothetical protein QCI82_03710 [Candidatus Thermoplasmatota archaeon]|nr:hypothetical protein [Candidatus Thermoplasmatota archaeon]
MNDLRKLLLLCMIICLIIPFEADGSRADDMRWELDISIVEMNLKNATDLSYGRRVNGSVVMNESDTTLRIFKVHIPHKGLDRYTELYINLEMISISGEIYLVNYYPDLTKADNNLYSHLKDNDQKSFWIDYEDVRTDHLYLVIYGNGDFELSVHQVTRPSFSGTFLLISIFIGSFIFLLLMMILLIYYNYYKPKILKKEAGHIEKHLDEGKERSGISDYSSKQKAKNLFDKIIKYFYNIFSFFSIPIIILFFFITNEMTITKPWETILLGSFIMIGISYFGVFIFLLSFWYDRKYELEEYLKNKKTLKTPIPNFQMFKEKIILTGRLRLSIPIILINIYAIYHIIHFYIIEPYSIDSIFEVFIFYILFGFMVIIFCLLVLLFHTSIYKVECKKGVLICSNGIFSRTIYRSKDIVRIHPVTTSIWFDLFPGRCKVDGTWVRVKTAVVFVMKNGKIETVLTSRPMNVIALMER